jgi:hypothetical protein
MIRSFWLRLIFWKARRVSGRRRHLVGNRCGSRALGGGTGMGASRPEHAHGLIVGTVEHENRRKNVMTRTFSMDTTVAPPSLLTTAKRAASENGATLLGDERSGCFSHEMVRGEYRTIGQTVIVTITDKHWLLPWSVVEAQLRELVR